MMTNTKGRDNNIDHKGGAPSDGHAGRWTMHRRHDRDDTQCICLLGVQPAPDGEVEDLLRLLGLKSALDGVVDEPLHLLGLVPASDGDVDGDLGFDPVVYGDGYGLPSFDGI